ncbi:MAG: hypothetical protein WBQ72_17870 [Terriglobales bacterium]|jgi:hypothetical protein
MRLIKATVVIAIVLLAGLAVAGENSLGVSNLYRVNFSQNVRVADTLLPSGDYEIRHVMEGANHIMVFRQVGVKKAVEIRAKCTLVPLPEKATETQKVYELNAANERVLHELIFKGDTSKHVF